MFALLLFISLLIRTDSISLSWSKKPSLQSQSNNNHIITSESINNAVTLPWSESIQPSRKLSYMSILQNQLQLMKSHNIEKIKTDEKFSYRLGLGNVKPAHISSMTFKSSIFRKIRLTYFDAGENVQVFNTLWYPDYKYDIPMLGVDLISLGKNRVLSVIDLQPLLPTTEYSDKYISPLKNIRDKYPDLHGQLSGKIYDDISFFSKNMLFGRFTDESNLTSVVEPAFNEYMKYYLNLSETVKPDESREAVRAVTERQKAYDIYSASKDPAVGLFDAYFGKEWSSSFVHDYLFELSKKPDNEYAAPVHNFKIAS